LKEKGRKRNDYGEIVEKAKNVYKMSIYKVSNKKKKGV
jgi:hypothetical protein